MTEQDNPVRRMVPGILGLLACLAAAPCEASQARQTELLLLTEAGDTVSRERLRYEPNRMHLELLSPMMGTRFAMSIELLSSGVPTAMTNQFWLARDEAAAAPRETAYLSFVAESVFVEIPGRPTQRIGTQAGAIPYINPSFGLLELFLARAARLDGNPVSVPALMVQGGQTVAFTISRLHRDSAVVGIAGAEAHLALDSAGRITGGVVPSQRLRLLRVPVGGAWAGLPPPDYSPPPDAPYRAIDVRIPTPAGHELAGTLTLPAGAGPGRPVPAVITATGSGLQDRDQSLPHLPGYRPFRQIADTLSRHGIAVLRLDDRGFGASGGQGGTATSADFADDIRAGLAWLRHRTDIEGHRLGIVGHSEGGLVAPMVAREDSALAAIVLMAAPSRTGKEIIAYQQESAIGRLPGLNDAQRDSLRRDAASALEAAAADQPWIRFFLDYDPLPAIRNVRHTAVLILHGETDLQVTADQGEELEAALRSAGHPDVTRRVYPETNHLFLADSSGDPSQYTRLTDRHVRPEVLGEILGWLSARLRP